MVVDVPPDLSVQSDGLRIIAVDQYWYSHLSGRQRWRKDIVEILDWKTLINEDDDDDDDDRTVLNKYLPGKYLNKRLDT